MTTKKASLALLISSAFLISGCSDGEDGKNGEDGQPGGPGGPGDPGTSGLHIDMAAEAMAEISNATYADGIITVDFELENKQGVGLHSLSAENEYHDFRFSLAQLQTNTGSDLKQWISLLNDATNDDGTTFEQGFEQIKNCAECLVDHKDGTYTYTFDTNLTTTVDAAGVVFDPALTQRIAIEMQFEYASGHELAENAHYDWIPATNATEGVETRELVILETCYTCHQPDSLKAHGGRRLDLENCQSCHNGIVSDPNDVSVELGHMVHAIHMGPEREGKDAEGNVVPMPYTIAGYGGDHAFDYPAFPTKPFMDCAVCHVQDETLADKDLWLSNANANACTGCHTDSPAQHKSDKNPEFTCTDCHNVAVHSESKKPYNAAESYDVVFKDVDVSVAGTISFKVQALTNDGTVITPDQIFWESYDFGKYAKPYVVVSWDVEKDYPEQIGNATYSKRRINVKDHAFADGFFNITTDAIDIPTDIATRSLELLPLFKVCFEGSTPADCEYVSQSSLIDSQYPAYIQSEPYRVLLDNAYGGKQVRRPIVDTASCFGCHSKEFYHDSNGVNCIACHTNDKQLGSVEDENGDAVTWGEKKSSSFMYKAHKASGHDNGHGGSGTILKTDCTTCHSAVEGYSGLDYGFELGRNAGSAHTVPSFIASEGNTDPVLTYYASPDAAACMSCHQKYLSDAAMSHMELNGAYIGPNKDKAAEDASDTVGNAKDAKEACATCHSPEKIMEHHGFTL